MDEDDPDVLVVKKSVVAEDGEGERADIDRPERGDRRVQVDPVERDDDDLRREQVAGGEEHQDDQVEPPAELRDGERDDRRKQQGEQHAGAHDNQCVDVVVGQLRVVPDRDVVVEVERAGPRYRASVDRFVERTQRAVEGPHQGEQPQHRHEDEERMQGDSAWAKRPCDASLAQGNRHDTPGLITRDR